MVRPEILQRINNTHTKHYESWTIKEFKALPKFGRFEGEPEYPQTADCFVILPTRKRHNSGYRIVDVIVIKDDKPIGKFADMTDHFYITHYDESPKHWSIDWLPVSGLMRIWACGYDCMIRSPFSTFEIQTTKSK